MPARLTAALCERLGLPVPTPDPGGGCDLVLPDGYSVRITGSREEISLAGVIRELPEKTSEKEALCRELLLLSLGRARRECGPFLPRLSVEGASVLLRQTCPRDGNLDDFEARVERFVNLMETWRTLAGREKERPARPAVPLPPGAGRAGFFFP
jgi:hypothetical protein